MAGCVNERGQIPGGGEGVLPSPRLTMMSAGWGRIFTSELGKKIQASRNLEFGRIEVKPLSAT